MVFHVPGLTMPVVRVHIVAVGVYNSQCSCHWRWVCYMHGDWQPVVHIDSNLLGDSVLVGRPDRLAHLIVATS